VPLLVTFAATRFGDFEALNCLPPPNLRVIRKELAIQDAVPAYAVFTDAELAELCKLTEITSQTVKNIKGIADKRMEKYGIALTELYAKS